MFWRFHKTCARRSNSPLWRDNDIARRACSDKLFVFTIERQPVFIQNLYCSFYIYVFGTLKKAIKENFPLSLEHEEYPVKYVQGFFFFSSVLPFSPRWLYMDFLTVSVFNFFIYFSPSKYFNSYSYHFACSSRGWRIMYRDGENFRISSIKVLFPQRRRW